jgi:hypothetical protein
MQPRRLAARPSFPALTLGVIVATLDRNVATLDRNGATLELQQGIAIPILPKENGSSR